MLHYLTLNIRITTLVVSIILGSTATNHAQEVPTIDLILLAGQSNMRGQGLWEQRDPTSHPADTDQNVMMYQNGTQAGDDRVLPFKALSYRLKDNVEVFGMAVPLARELYDAGHNNIAIINGAVGGSNISDWDSDIENGNYQRFLDKITEGIAALEGDYTVNLLGFGWQQGEANNIANTPSDEYFDALTDLVADLKDDINLLLLDNPGDDMTTVLMEPSYVHVDETIIIPNVADAMIGYAVNTENNAIYIQTRDIKDRVVGDNLHWGAIGITTAGKRLFLALTNKYKPEPNMDNFITSPPAWDGIWLEYWGFQDSYNDGIEPYLPIAAGEPVPIQWRQIEDSNGVFDFSILKDRLQRSLDNDYYYQFELWAGSHCPDWIYNYGVPEVKASGKDWSYPDYKNETFKYFAKRFYNAMADTLASYPTELSERLVFIMPGFGATGDRQLWKGDPFDPQYELTNEEYLAYMQEMAHAITTAFWKNEVTSDLRFRWNVDEYEGNVDDSGLDEEQMFGAWIRQNYNAQLRKQQFTIAIGYMTPNEKDQDNSLRDDFFGNDPERMNGNPDYVVGEFQEERFATTPMTNINPELHYLWTSISSVDRGLDGWILKYNNMSPDYLEAYEFSERYSFHKKAAKSPVAFIALRDVLDYSDGDRFPTEDFGGGDVDKQNQVRMDAILAEYSDYGAKNDDSPSVKNRANAVYLEYCEGFNDCTWNVIDRNYRRFITQITPNETSSGYWRVGLNEDGSGEPYGRFARGFDIDKEYNAMHFDVDDAYFADEIANGQGEIKIKVIYYEDDSGSWDFKYRAQDGIMKSAGTIVNDADANNGWSSVEFMIEDAKFDNGGELGSDFRIDNVGNTNIRFHLIELETQSPYNGQVHQIPGNIECEFYDEGGEGLAYHDDENKTGDLTLRAYEMVDLVEKETGSNKFAVTSFLDGEWLEYTANVTEGSYDISLHYFAANTTDGEINVYLGDELIATIDDIQGNGDNSIPQSKQVSCKFMTGGEKRILKIEHNAGSGFAIDRIDFIESVGEENIWIGPDVGFWLDSPTNWSLDKIPDECSQVTIPSPKKVIIRKNETAISKNKVNVLDGGRLVVRNNATLTIIR